MPDADASKPISKAEFARQQGLTRGRISQLVTEGLPVRADGRIDPAAASEWMARTLDPARRTKGRANKSAAARSNFAAAKADKEQTNAEIARLDLEERRRILVNRQEVSDAIFRRARLERDAHLAWVVRVAPMIAGELGCNERRLFDAMDVHMRKHLEQLADTPIELMGDGHVGLG